MKVLVDKNKCIGCSACVAIAPEVFEFDKDGKSKIKQGTDLEKNKELIKQVKETCPNQAISIEE